MATTPRNIDRPLDEIVKESRAAKRKLQKEKRQKEREAKAVVDEPKPAETKTEIPKDTTPKAKGSIRKKRRSRGGGGGGDKRVEGQVERKVEKKATPAAGGTSDADGGGARKPNKGAKVSVFNLDHGVTQSDITELFETVGPLRSARLIVLSDGRSSGSAEVVFENMEDALTAIQRYNNVPLDNRPLKITLATASAPIRVSRGRRGGRKLVVEGAVGVARGGRDSPPERDTRVRGNGVNGGGRDFDMSPDNKDDARFDDGDRDRFEDARGYSRRNGRRSRNSRSYDRRGGSPGAEQMYVD